MNKKTTKVLAFLLAALMASSLASCSQEQDFTAGMSEEEKAAWEADVYKRQFVPLFLLDYGGQSPALFYCMRQACRAVNGETE